MSDYFTRLAARAIAAGSTPNPLRAVPAIPGGRAFDTDESTEALTSPPLHRETSTIVHAPAPAPGVEPAPAAADPTAIVEHHTTINHVHGEPPTQPTRPPAEVAVRQSPEVRQLPPQVIRVPDRITTHERESHSTVTNTTVVVEPQTELRAPPQTPAQWRASFPEKLTPPTAPTIEIRVNRIVVKGDQRPRRSPLPTSATRSPGSGRDTHAVDLADYLERRSGQ